MCVSWLTMCVHTYTRKRGREANTRHAHAYLLGIQNILFWQIYALGWHTCAKNYGLFTVAGLRSSKRTLP